MGDILSTPIVQPKKYRLDKIVVHCLAIANLQAVSLKAIEKDHIARGFGGIGYHLIIQPDGTTEKTRPQDEVGCHVSGHNTGALGIALAGTDRFTMQQLNSLKYWVDTFGTVYQIPIWQIYCHNQFDTAIKQGKTCPNMSINRLLYFLITSDYKAIDIYLPKK